MNSEGIGIHKTC